MIQVNGVNGAAGSYLLPPLSSAVGAALARGERLDPEDRRQLRRRYEAITGSFLNVIDADPTDLGQAGWGVVFAHGADPAVREALLPLLEHRRRQATAVQERRYREYWGAEGYRNGEAVVDFLVRHQVTPGQPANPQRMPYYLLLVGDPETIPFRFQYMLDVVYAVGRLDLDTPEEYDRYARSVVAAERATGRRQTTFFGVRNPDDQATGLSADHLVAPLAAAAAEWLPPGSLQAVIGERATKAMLSGLLGGPDTPALLFAAAHGLGFPNGDSRQLPRQGAVLCQDWPGPVAWRGRIPEAFYLAADDLTGDARPWGLIAFLFACFGAGTPRDRRLRPAGARRPVPDRAPRVRGPTAQTAAWPPARWRARCDRPRRTRLGVLVPVAGRGRAGRRLSGAAAAAARRRAGRLGGGGAERSLRVAQRPPGHGAGGGRLRQGA